MICTSNFLLDFTTPGQCDALETHLEVSYIAAFSDSFDGFHYNNNQACMMVYLGLNFFTGPFPRGYVTSGGQCHKLRFSCVVHPVFMFGSYKNGFCAISF